METTLDFVNGNTRRCLFSMALPLIAAMFLNMAYNLVDSLWIGNLLGETAYAALTNSTPIILILSAIAMGASNGISILLSQVDFSANSGGNLFHGLFLSGCLCTGLYNGISVLLFHGSSPQLREFHFSNARHASVHAAEHGSGSSVYPPVRFSGRGGGHSSVTDAVSCMYAGLFMEEKAVFLPYTPL